MKSPPVAFFRELHALLLFLYGITVGMFLVIQLEVKQVLSPFAAVFFFAGLGMISLFHFLSLRLEDEEIKYFYPDDGGVKQRYGYGRGFLIAGGVWLISVLFEPARTWKEFFSSEWTLGIFFLLSLVTLILFFRKRKKIRQENPPPMS